MNGQPATVAVGDSDKVRVTTRFDDPDGGVKAVRIWVSMTRSNPGTIEAPTLSGTPVAVMTSNATVGQPADATQSVSWEFDVPNLQGSFQSIKLDIFAEGENFHSGISKTPTLSLTFSWTDLHLRIVPLADDDGSHAFQVTPGDFSTLVNRVNQSFKGTGIRILFDPTSDWVPQRNTVLNRDEPGQRAAGNAAAASLPGKILLYLRWGPDNLTRTGNANAFPPPGANPKPANVSDVTQNYIALEDILDLNSNGFLNLLHGSHVAHELGHYLGLYHTFPGWTSQEGPVYQTATRPNQSQADQSVFNYILANGGTIDALDGDAIQDTPPDPSPVLYLAHSNQDPCVTPQITAIGTMNNVPVSFIFDPDVTNVMSYYALCNGKPLRFTPDQIKRMYHALSNPARSHLLTP